MRTKKSSRPLSRPRSWQLWLTLVALHAARPARASMFGEENITLGAILAQVTFQVSQMMEMVDSARRGVDTATASLHTMREIVAAVDSTVYLVRNPEEILSSARFDYLTTFPELQAFQREAIALNDEIRSSPTGFDSQAYVRAFTSTSNTYEMFMSLSEDRWGMSEEHQRAIKNIQDLGNDAVALQARLAMGGLDAKGLAGVTAQGVVNISEGIAAVAQQESEMVRVQRQLYLEEQERRMLATAASMQVSAPIGAADDEALRHLAGADVHGVVIEGE